MKQIQSIAVAELTAMADLMYGNFVKAVADVSKGLLVVDAEMHVDAEHYLLERGSLASDLWGFNLYPAKFGTDDFIEFDSMINIRPKQANFTRSITDSKIRQQIKAVVERVVKP